MAGVRSAQLALDTTCPVALTTVFSVPGGFVCLVKSIAFDNYSGALANISVQIVKPSGATAVIDGQPLAVGETRNQQVWNVAQAGDVIKLISSQANVTYIISGALLG